MQVFNGQKIQQSVIEYRKILNGKIEYPKSYETKEFKGFIKMQKDPKGVEFEKNNMISRGSTLRNCSWIYGLVIYCAYDC